MDGEKAVVNYKAPVVHRTSLINIYGLDWEGASEEFVTEALLISNWLMHKGVHTQRNYQREIKAFLAFFKGQLLKEITVTHINAYIKFRKKQLSAESLNFIRSTLSSLFGFCIRSGYLKNNPVLLVDRMKSHKKFSQRILTSEEVYRMIEVADNLRDRLILEVLYKTGLRVGELVQLTWDHFLLMNSGVRLSVVGKGSKARSLHISVSDHQSLLRLKDFYPKPCDFLFCHKKSPYQPLSTVSIFKIIRKLAQKAGIHKNVSPHWLRHTHATHALENGAPIHIVKQTLGHDSVATTDKYLNANPSHSSTRYVYLSESDTKPSNFNET